MADFKVELNSSGVRAMLKSEEMKKLLDGYASQIASRCGSGYAHDTYAASTRVIASVSTDSYDAMRDNLENNTILKAVGK